MKIIRGLHTVYALIIFMILFILLLPLFLIPIFRQSQFHLTGIFNRIWANLFFRLTFFPIDLEYRFNYKEKRQYVFCPNHFSYLDIPTMGLNKINAVFVGKNDMENIPLFGYMYRKLHITVDRTSLKSRYNTILRSFEAIDEGKSLMIFPEGGILTNNVPEMVKFKDGAFRTAIEKQIPIVPVTIPYNWIILPDGQWLPKVRTIKVIYHEPIETKGLTLENLAELKQQTFDTIDQELKKALNES
ncbi:lysophospholipid acyltransferase family protein [Fulvivirga lutea]|uniref:1-acyl-sn-glycerol-3-phosphate acyltransferase n=1 Tax=Fulvivirga lutea TaxID=2810512 RepID=A0A974WFW8_9BACT|nr:lysophospholipid acyltransferase family protein [Fulvivirga lutea]QSE97723.1 1-acyl-sn-glycerol-3-phosphate acyltransferase [Fulvivirga lutea]